MNPELQSVLDEFIETLDEVEVLLASAHECEKDKSKYAAFTKSALLLLSGKFENFVELVAEEYIFTVNQSCLKATSIPSHFKLYHSYSVIEQIQKLKGNRERTTDVINLLNQIGSIWVLDQPFTELQIDCKFSFGKHGEDELRKLFIPIGITDIFEQIKVNIEDDTDPGQKIAIDFKGIYNSITNLRNNILHQNASPGLTHKKIREYKIIVQVFASEIVSFLDKQLLDMAAYRMIAQ